MDYLSALEELKRLHDEFLVMINVEGMKDVARAALANGTIASTGEQAKVVLSASVDAAVYFMDWLLTLFVTM